MKKMERRSIICLTLAAVLLIGTILFVVRFVKYGGKWATFYGNQSLYTNGMLTRGAVYDTNGEVLLKNTANGPEYNPDQEIREATVQIVGDAGENISTSVISLMKDKIIGYSPITGIYNISEKSNDIKLTIDADISRVAYEAMGQYNGFVSVYNYKTGDIVCMVSKPTFDPMNPPSSEAEQESGMFINKPISSTMTPGSIFKTVTAAAAIENIDDIDSFSYNCNGTRMINGEPLKCYAPHGHVDFDQALAQSCNGAFSVIGEELGASTMKEYVKKLGLTKSYNINGIHTQKGSFEFPENVPLNLGWACDGQYKDLINPCSMMVYMGAVANGGKAANPNLIHHMVKVPSYTHQMIEPTTADQLSEMMRNDVITAYGQSNFPDLDIHAKTGTAEVGIKGADNGWFAGFITNPGKPYAFVVCMEKSGYGGDAAARVTNTVLQEIVNR